MSLFPRGDVWWYEFWFAGRRIRESSKSPSKTVAKGAEQKRNRELEAGFNNFTDLRRERIRLFRIWWTSILPPTNCALALTRKRSFLINCRAGPHGLA